MSAIVDGVSVAARYLRWVMRFPTNEPTNSDINLKAKVRKVRISSTAQAEHLFVYRLELRHSEAQYKNCIVGDMIWA